MNKSISLKGKIIFSTPSHPKATRKSILFKYGAPLFKDNPDSNFADTMMSSFGHLKLSSEEKKNLSRTHRKVLNCYQQINPFTLNLDAKILIEEINQSKESKIVIHANHYAAYVCLAAFYSGKINSDKKIEFILEKAPLALFPKTLIKNIPKATHMNLTFQVEEDCWLRPFSSLYHNQNMKYSLKKVA